MKFAIIAITTAVIVFGQVTSTPEIQIDQSSSVSSPTSSSSSSNHFSSNDSSFPDGPTYTCIDISQTVCGKHGVQIQYPVPVSDQYPYQNVSSFDTYINSVFTNINTEFATGCGLSGSVDVTQGGNGAYMGYFCKQFFVGTFNPFSNSTAAKTCNGGNVVKVQPICKSSCQEFVTTGIIKIANDLGCNNQTFLSESVNGTDICDRLPDSDCTTNINSGSTFRASFALIAVAVLTLINVM